MTKERISKLSHQDLIKLAEIFSLDSLDDLDLQDDDINRLSPQLRAELEEQIFELIEESRKEQSTSDAHPVNYHQKHFLGIEELFGRSIESDADFFAFPDQYNVTRIMLMLRDPEWAYAYWDISNQDRANLLQKADFKNFVLIIKEIQDDYSKAVLNPDSPLPEPVVMEIPVQISDNNWYINLPRKHSSFIAELAVVFVSGKHEILARSGVIRVPSGSFSRGLESINSRESEVLIAMSGIEHMGLSGFEGLPRRIVEVLESGGTSE